MNTCTECKHWKSIASRKVDELGRHTEKGEGVGECHRYPPAHAAALGGTFRAFAATRAGDWCSEWSQKPAVSFERSPGSAQALAQK